MFTLRNQAETRQQVQGEKREMKTLRYYAYVKLRSTLYINTGNGQVVLSVPFFFRNFFLFCN